MAVAESRVLDKRERPGPLTGSSRKSGSRRPATPGLLQDLLMAVSLANLSLCISWQRIFSPRQLLMPDWSPRDLLVLGLVLTALSAVFLLVIRYSRRFRAPLLPHELLFLFPVVLMAYLLRQSVPAVYHTLSDTRLVLLGSAGLLILGILVLAKWREKVVPVLEFATAFSVVLVPLFFLHAIQVVRRSPPPVILAALQPAPQNSPRVVWIIFDEMDPRYTFDQRAKNLSLPQFDRLRAESMYASNVAQAEHDTDVAMPSLIFGQHVFEIVFNPKTKLLGKVEGTSQIADLRTAYTDVFADSRAAGLNAGVVGWFLPYCRLFSDELSRCDWQSMYGNSDAGFGPRLQSVLFNLSPWQSRQQQVQRYFEMRAQAQDMASDSTLSLVLLHLPVPHGPGIYDRVHHHITAFAPDEGDWYNSNLQLADVTLGQIRRSMEDKGLWDTTTVIVSSDHKLRLGSPPHSDGKVPYFIKLAGQTRGDTCTAALNARITRSLISFLLRKRITSPSDLQNWLLSQSLTFPNSANTN